MKIEGKLIQVDPSGQGHAWRTADEDICPADIQAEIAAEIIDGRQSQRVQPYIASNGIHYRWSPISRPSVYRRGPATILVNGVQTEVPSGAIAYKHADPVEDARWVYDEADVEDIRSADPSLIVPIY